MVASSKKGKLLQAFNTIISALTNLEQMEQEKILNTVFTFLGIKKRKSTGEESESNGKGSEGLKDDKNQTHKEFLKIKKPKSETQRVVCLGYYLTHSLDKQHFKTIDITKLNNDAGQIKLSNTAVPMDNAVRDGYMASVGKGQKQLTVHGEDLVNALPDQEAAGKVRKVIKKRKKQTGKAKNKSKKK